LMQQPRKELRRQLQAAWAADARAYLSGIRL
jgi:hypothetical protein